ncbi:MAG: hypothetical protein J0H69_00590 [Burkholderiales bacterium]|nr:hypothetical protein [Burkholderiales bacterium]
MKSALLLTAIAGLLSALAEAAPEMRDRLAEPTLQKLNAAKADVDTAATEFAVADAQGALDESMLPPFVLDLLAEARTAFAARDARDTQAIELATRSASALETIADLLAAHLPATTTDEPAAG